MPIHDRDHPYRQPRPRPTAAALAILSLIGLVVCLVALCIINCPASAEEPKYHPVAVVNWSNSEMLPPVKDDHLGPSQRLTLRKESLGWALQRCNTCATTSATRCLVVQEAEGYYRYVAEGSRKRE